RIKTTQAKAKALKTFIERLIILGKRNNLSARREALKILHDNAVVNRLFSQIAPLFKNRTSGFSRIMLFSHRLGDGAQMVLIELTEKIAVQPKPKPTKAEKSGVKQEPAREKKPEEKEHREEKPKFPQERPKPFTKEKPKKKFLGGLRKLFKKERDSL
ncbi:MAG: 50S ribosomal protein L17, partial [Candidatus Omnitrophica bacterium]|nr:50S ribosomal protein L17 [Candidatus Omnitrophota bacterium]